MAPRAKKYAKKTAEQEDGIAGLTRFGIPHRRLLNVVQYLKEHPGLVDAVNHRHDLSNPHVEIGELRAQGTWPHGTFIIVRRAPPPPTFR